MKSLFLSVVGNIKMNWRIRRSFKILILLTILFSVNSNAEIWQDTTFSQEGQLTDADHFVRVFVHDTSPETTHLTINGGQIGTVFTYDNSITTISGGTFRGAYYSYHPENNDGDNLFLAPYSSSVYVNNQSTVIYNSGDLDYVNGGVENSIKCTDDSHLIVNGGSCSITALENATVNITNGLITNIATTDRPYLKYPPEANCQLYLTGGTFTGTVFLTSNSQMYIYGYDFLYNPDGVVETPKGGTMQVGILSGRWQGGTPFEIKFDNFFGEDSYEHVVLVEIPEPSTVLFFSFAFISIRLRKLLFTNKIKQQ